MARGGQYNPTQAGFSDEGGTVCVVEKTDGKLVVPLRGCSLYNGDGVFDYTRWENIVADHPNINDNNNSDQDNIDEENLSVEINGNTYTNQAAEVHSDFDFYCEYKNVKNKFNLEIPAVHHYIEYHFIRSSTLPNAAMKQFNITALDAIGKWIPQRLSNDISTEFPSGVHPGSIDNLNYITLSWTIRADVQLWNPLYRYIQRNDNSWQIHERTNSFTGNYNNLKSRFIISDSNDENTGHALGFYLPETDINTFSVVGVNDSDKSVVYNDDRLIEKFYLDDPYRTSNMSQMGFRLRLKGLIDRSILSTNYPGVYEKIRQEYILLYGTPAQIMTAFSQLDTYFQTLSSSEISINDNLEFEMYPNPTNTDIYLNLSLSESKIKVFDINGKKIFESVEFSKHAMIPKSIFDRSGLYFVSVNNSIKKLLVY